MSLELFLQVIDRLRSWLEFRSQMRAAQDERFDRVVREVYKAAVNTRGYIADIRADPQNRSRRREQEIAAAWVDVGCCLREAGNAADGGHLLADRCFQKADYWADPSRWSATRVREAGIQLDGLVEHVLRLAEDGHQNEPA